jgi:sugar phosphate isomerase/epimerase
MPTPNTKIALELYTLRDFFGTEKAFAEAMQKTRKAGYEAVEVAGVPSSIPRPFIKKVLDDNGMICMANQAGLPGLTDDLSATIDELGVLECTHTALAAAPNELRSGEGYRKLASILNEAGAKLAEHGIALAYHNHWWEFQRYGKSIAMDILYDNTDPTLLEAKLDTAWIQKGGGDVVMWIRRLADRMSVIHFKDYTIVDNEIVLAEVGEGNLNWSGILKACGGTDLRWYVVEQDRCSRDPFESIRISYENLKGWGVE